MERTCATQAVESRFMVALLTRPGETEFKKVCTRAQGLYALAKGPPRERRRPRLDKGVKRWRPEKPSSEGSWLKRKRREVSAAAAEAGALTPTRRPERPHGWTESHEQESKRLRRVCTGRAVEALRDGHLLQEETTPALLRAVAQEKRKLAKYDEARRRTRQRREERLGQLDRRLDWSRVFGETAWVQTAHDRVLRAQVVEYIVSTGLRVTEDCHTCDHRSCS